jgi:membrane-associated phospholipid phosphatase
MNEIIAWDQALFRSINTGLANPFFDAFLPYLRFSYNWIPVYVFFAVFLIYNFRRQGMYIVLAGALAAAVSDQLSSHLLKNLVHRIRPCSEFNLIGHVRLLVDSCGAGTFSFPSSHAVNHFTFAVFIISVFPKKAMWVKPVLLIWASLIAFSQVYVGLHYPIDIILGALIGSLIGYVFAAGCKTAFHIDLDAELE